MNPPRFAVVVATKDRGGRITPLLESVLRSEATDFELVIVDQSDAAATRLAVEPFLADPRVRYVHLDVAGTSHARNHGIASTSAPVIAITDDDCTVPPDWLEQLGRPFALHPEVGVLYCNVDPAPVTEPGHTPHIRFRTNRVIAGFGDVRPGQPLWMGAGMAVRRTAVADGNGFDELLGPGRRFPACEDNDIAWRAMARGWWVYEHAQTAVVHDGFRSLEQLREHSKRDFYGIGATMAKYVKTRNVRITAMWLVLFVRFAVVLPAKDLVGRRVPRGWGRPYMLVRGVLDGLRTPLDRARLLYVDRSAEA